MRNFPTLRLSAVGRPRRAGPGRASPGQSPPRDFLPSPGPSRPARGVGAQVSPSPRLRSLVLAEVRRVGSAARLPQTNREQLHGRASLAFLSLKAGLRAPNVKVLSKKSLQLYNVLEFVGRSGTFGAACPPRCQPPLREPASPLLSQGCLGSGVGRAGRGARVQGLLGTTPPHYGR